MRALDLFSFVNRVLADGELHERLKQDPQGTLEHLANDPQSSPGTALSVEDRHVLAQIDWSETNSDALLANLRGRAMDWGFSTTDDPNQIQEWTSVFYAQVDSESQMAAQDLRDRIARWAASAQPLTVFLYPPAPVQPKQDYVCFVIWHDSEYKEKADAISTYINEGSLKPYASSAAAAQVANYRVMAEVVGIAGQLVADYGVLTYWLVKEIDRRSFESWAFDRQCLEQQVGGDTFQGGILLREIAEPAGDDHRYSVLSGYVSAEARLAIDTDPRMVEFDKQHPTAAYARLDQQRAFARGKQLIAGRWH